MNVNEIIHSLRETPQEWKASTDYRWVCSNSIDIYRLEPSYLDEGIRKYITPSLIDRLRLRYAIWRWKCNQNKMFEWYVDDDGLPYLRKIKK